jgi:hypothetical protein
MCFVLQVAETEAELVGVETEEAEFREDGIKVVVGVVIKIEAVAFKTGVGDTKGVIIVEVVTRTEGVIIVEVVTRTEGVAMVEATRIEGVVEEGVVVVEAEGGIITIDRWRHFPCICL